MPVVELDSACRYDVLLPCDPNGALQMESWPRILGFLPRSLKGFLLNQFREEASEAQLKQLSSIIYKHVGGPAPLAPDYHTRRSAPVPAP